MADSLGLMAESRMMRWNSEFADVNSWLNPRAIQAERMFHLARQIAEASQAAIGNETGGPLRGVTLDHRTQGVDLGQFARRDGGHLRPGVGRYDDEPLERQPPQGLPHRRA